MNEFNTMLRNSLLSPRKHRYIATIHEQELMERASMSQPSMKNSKGAVSRNNAGRSNTTSQPATKNAGGILPIISVGSSMGSVEFQQNSTNS